MARITLRQLLDHAAEHDYGLPAYNINNMEQGLAIMEAADAVNAPVIIQASRGARQYANDIMLKHMMDAVVEIYPHIPVCVHLDHGNEPATCMTAIQAGFTSVMMDGSLKADGKTPGDWDYNVGVTKTVTDMAHLGGISVEGELGVLNKAHGEKRALKQLFENMETVGFVGGRVRIRHTENPKMAEALAAKIREIWPSCDIRIGANRGLWSYYCEPGGVLVGFEG